MRAQVIRGHGKIDDITFEANLFRLSGSGAGGKGQGGGQDQGALHG